LSIVGGGGSDTIEATNDVNFMLEDTFLHRTGVPNIALESVERANLTGGGGDNAFIVGGWSGAATLVGDAGADTIAVTDDVARMSLTNTALARTGRGRILHSDMESAELTGGPGNNVINALNFANFVVIYGFGGNDTLTGSAGYSIVVGGEGDDRLNAGSGQTILVGGNGNDTLKVVGDPLGGITAGHAVLIGGAGRDQLTGGVGEDALIDSATSFDESTAELATLLVHWTGGGLYADRVAQLTTDLSGHLTPDGESDTLRGGLDALDLFFTNLTGPSLEADVLLDRDDPPVEIVVDNA
jgi:Ca2+-binding RTX toxin-like protein